MIIPLFSFLAIEQIYTEILLLRKLLIWLLLVLMLYHPFSLPPKDTKRKPKPVDTIYQVIANMIKDISNFLFMKGCNIRNTKIATPKFIKPFPTSFKPFL